MWGKYWRHKRPLFAGHVLFFDTKISIKAGFLKNLYKYPGLWLLLFNIFAFLMVLKTQKICVYILCPCFVSIFCVYICVYILCPYFVSILFLYFVSIFCVHILCLYLCLYFVYIFVYILYLNFLSIFCVYTLSIFCVHVLCLNFVSIFCVYICVYTLFIFLSIFCAYSLSTFCVYISKTVLGMCNYYTTTVRAKHKVQRLTAEMSRNTSARKF